MEVFFGPPLEPTYPFGLIGYVIAGWLCAIYRVFISSREGPARAVVEV